MLGRDRREFRRLSVGRTGEFFGFGVFGFCNLGAVCLVLWRDPRWASQRSALLLVVIILLRKCRGRGRVCQEVGC